MTWATFELYWTNCTGQIVLNNIWIIPDKTLLGNLGTASSPQWWHWVWCWPWYCWSICRGNFKNKFYTTLLWSKLWHCWWMFKIIHTSSGDCPRSQRGFHEGSKACNGASQEQRVQPVLGQNFHIPHHGAWRRPPRAQGGTSQKNSALFGEVEIPFRFQQGLVLPSIINVQVKDHSKTGKDEHLGSFAARISDMQEGKQPVSSFTFQTNFSGYRRVFLSDYSGREMRPASLFLKISKKWDAQWDGSPMCSLINPRNFPLPIPRIPSKKCDARPVRQKFQGNIL